MVISVRPANQIDSDYMPPSESEVARHSRDGRRVRVVDIKVGFSKKASVKVI